MGTYIIKKKRSSSYYFRIVIPQDLRPVLIKRTIILSLRTGILHQAKKQASFLYVITQQIFEQIRKFPAMKQLDLDGIKEILKERLKFYQESAKEDIQRDNYLISDQERKSQSAHEEIKLNATVEVAKMGNLFDNMTQDVLKHHGYEIKEDSKEYNLLKKNLFELERNIKNYRQDLLCCEIEGEWNLLNSLESEEPPQTTPSSTVQTPTKPQTKTHPISTIINNFLEEKKRAESLTDKSFTEYSANLHMLVEVFGDIAIQDLSFEKAREFKEVLLKLPKNRNKQSRYKGKSIATIIRLPNIETMSNTSLRSQLLWLDHSSLHGQRARPIEL